MLGGERLYALGEKITATSNMDLFSAETYQSLA